MMFKLYKNVFWYQIEINLSNRSNIALLIAIFKEAAC